MPKDKQQKMPKASLRDHREIGKELDLFTISELVGSGLPLFTPKGAVLRNLMEEYIRQLLKEYGYEQVWIPHIARKELYDVSGHLEKFKADMFPLMKTKGREYVLKGMNCPHHIQIFARKPISYKEMPQRYAETTTVYRSEQSGELGGLTRVLSITQDDGHVFCREDQVEEEFRKALEINQQMLQDFGFEKYWIRLSLWDSKNKEKYLGDEEVWEKMQNILRKILEENKIPFKEGVGEAAFYGPKFDLMVVDAHEREWQLSTIQLDFNLPERFKIFYIAEDGKEHRPYMIHRASFGSIERFLGVWLEHVQGNIPVWLAPVQAVILPITDRNQEYAQAVASKLKAEGIRTELDDRSETLQAKIRNAQIQKIPYMVIVGDKEQDKETVSVRLRSGDVLPDLKLEEFITRVRQVVADKRSL